MIPTTTNSGLHDFVGNHVLAPFVRPGLKAADLGSGPGAMAARLAELGCAVLAADLTKNGFAAELPHVTIDFNQSDFASLLGSGQFGLVTAIEVIEHVESPIGFLRNISRLLAPGGVAVLTTPNVDALPARFKFFLSGKILTMDEHGEPTHISPIFFDLLQRQFLPLAGLRLRQHLVFPAHGYQLSRRSISWAMRLLAAAFSGESIRGDNHILVLEAAP
jgi:2-polyprenyl-3-methyl-5-hydroxy-6-metoxy-1,4-benzoquinol methylase